MPGGGDQSANIVDEKQKDVRQTNITAARAVADVVRTSLGPRGMDKMVSISN
jgi:T-complex protein 1 subunit delta